MHSRLGFLVLSGLLLLTTASCDGTSGDDPDDDEFDRAGMLEHLGNDVIIPSYDALKVSTDALQTSTSAFASNPTLSTLTQLQNRLKSARLAWQNVNVFQFGPAESVTLRAALNTFPTDEDQIEDNIASGSYTLGTIENRAAVGFPALDFLLHDDGSSNEEILQRFTEGDEAGGRITYLQDNVAFIKEAVDATVDGWRRGGGNYIDTFLSQENAGTDVGSSLGMLVNAFVLHNERFIRDGKIGIPAGVRSAGVPRPASVESYHAGYSAELAVANMRTVKRLFLGNTPTGDEGLGLDDNLREIDAQALASEIETEMDQAIASLELLTDPLSNEIESDNERVLAAFTELQDVVVLLKADMTSLLGITITYQDNDGD